MATLVGTQSDPIELLRQLCQLDYDAIEAYEAAIERIDDGTYKQNLGQFLADHRRHVRDLNACIEALGGVRVDGGDVKRVLTQGKVVLAGLAGDRAILMAMKTNEDDTNKAYERAVTRGGFDAKITGILQQNLSDERRHRTWIEQTISAMGRPSRTSMDRMSSQSLV